MRRTTCGACGYDDLRVVLDLGMSPVADAYTETPSESVPTHPLQLAVCGGCHLVQLLEVLPQNELFGTGYSFYSSASAPLSTYHRNYAHEVIERHKLHYGRIVVEIGCNDGDMLRHFDAAGCRAIGVDPSGGPVKKALERGLDVVNEPFTVDVAHRIVGDYGQVDAVIANHVLAHVESVSEVLHGVAELLAPDGTAYVEVQYLPDLIVNNAFDLIYHEHRNFFSLTTLASAARRWGLHVRDVELTDRQGGSLRVALGRGAGRPSASASGLAAAERWLSTADAYGGLQGRANRMRDRLLEIVWSFDRVIGYGAPAKATTLISFCGLDVDDVAYVVDSTPAKQDRYVPGTGIQIVAPRRLDDVAAAVLWSWNYESEITAQHPELRERGGRWIVPVPSPRVI